jgi:hypothetical protein
MPPFWFTYAFPLLHHHLNNRRTEILPSHFPSPLLFNRLPFGILDCFSHLENRQNPQKDYAHHLHLQGATFSSDNGGKIYLD